MRRLNPRRRWIPANTANRALCSFGGGSIALLLDGPPIDDFHARRHLEGGEPKPDALVATTFELSGVRGGSCRIRRAVAGCVCRCAGAA